MMKAALKMTEAANTPLKSEVIIDQYKLLELDRALDDMVKIQNDARF